MNWPILFGLIGFFILIGCLVANIFIGVKILHESKRAADASVSLNTQFSNDMAIIKKDLHDLYEWIITHFPP